jgi:hypothetical protein
MNQLPSLGEAREHMKETENNSSKVFLVSFLRTVFVIA